MLSSAIPFEFDTVSSVSLCDRYILSPKTLSTVENHNLSPRAKHILIVDDDEFNLFALK